MHPANLHRSIRKIQLAVSSRTTLEWRVDRQEMQRRVSLASSRPLIKRAELANGAGRPDDKSERERTSRGGLARREEGKRSGRKKE